ncbi:GMP synthase [Microvirga tunisiensis]|uniref:GMP synthase n=2 Tax=Pannonibacter tanglangensis TaxID=2750084 RepID=A0A7X5JA42_9HYPH|nr:MULTISPECIES: type 1 glutamine amidotransferase [unclassified Pannonibacter]NBN64517.1 GMP synthase [Pannonibacter sp. XCT-34]NBN79051.1 GMP synthase [Pannonibacter sp. XCT-53]
MRVLAIENYHDTPYGNVGRALADAGVEVVSVRAFAGEPLPDGIGDHAGLVVFGGGQNALDDAGSPFLPRVCELIRGFHAADRPVMGICLGSQLIARSFGGRNIIGRPIEFGWHDVTPTGAGRTDPVFSALGTGAPLFHWHNDTFELPEGAVHLATSRQTQNQGFRLGRATYAFQFHFEAALPEVLEWSQGFADTIARDAPDWTARLPAEADRHAARADATGMALASNWVRLLQG